MKCPAPWQLRGLKATMDSLEFISRNITSASSKGRSSFWTAASAPAEDAAVGGIVGWLVVGVECVSCFTLYVTIV